MSYFCGSFIKYRLFKHYSMKKLSVLLILFLGFSSLQAQQLSSVKKNNDTQQVKNVSAIDFNEMLEETNYQQLIDIRTPQEFKAGHIKAAVLINFYDPNFSNNIENAELDKEKPIYIYCRSGHRSRNSIRIFKKLGFKKIINLAYGINDWYRNGLPIVK